MRPRSARFGELDSRTLYALLRLRVDVFVVEQACPYPELDGRDLEPDTVHLWHAGEYGAPLAYLRLLAEPGGARRISRVVTARHARGQGLADELVRAAIRLAAGARVTLEAQAHLEHWYARLGFERAGSDYVEDGIPHAPMRLRDDVVRD